MHRRHRQHRRISIHALREEGDLDNVTKGEAKVVFLSTPSARRATHGLQAGDVQVEISIHALREEGDPPRSCISPPSR